MPSWYTLATHSSTLAWKIPWMEESGRLQSIGLQRVGHDLAHMHLSSSFESSRIMVKCSCFNISHRSKIIQCLFFSVWLVSLSMIPSSTICTVANPNISPFYSWVNGNPLQYSCLENPKDKGVWQATVHGMAKNQTRLSDKAQGLWWDSCKQAELYVVFLWWTLPPYPLPDFCL